jgi:hypothetical protein
MQIGVITVHNKISYQFNMTGKDAVISLKQQENEEPKEPPTEVFAPNFRIDSNT